MPTLNRVELLRTAIESVQQQTYQNFKLVVVDDGSSDGTADYLASIDDPRIQYIRNEESQGACRSRNSAIEHLDTELVTGLDDDDIFLPHRLEDLLAVYDENYGFVCSGYYWDYGAHKKALFKDDREISLSDAFDLNQCSNQILVNRKRILAVGGFDEKIPALQDHDLWVRLIAKFGTAFRTGKPSYVVNDDRGLERISSVTNKLNAIEMFERKHDAIMSKRNKENFTFYKAKIEGKKFGFLEFVKSTQYGLVGLKARQYISQYFKTASKLRLKYLQTGNMSSAISLEWFFQTIIPLLATGGPGASRVILLSACIFFLGATESASFSGDFFVLMLLNTAFSQNYGFFLLKPEYSSGFNSILKQSINGLLLSALSLIGLYYVGLISEPVYALVLLVILHFYYIYRYKHIANQYFLPLAIAEITISLFCLLLPYLVSVFGLSSEHSPYQIYIIASTIGLFVVLWLTSQDETQKVLSVPFKNLRNISISTTASIFAIFILPASIKAIANPEVVSIVALTISCMSISMLIPRTYANKIMKNLAKSELEHREFGKLSSFYRKLMFASASVGLLITVAYLYVVDSSLGMMIIIVPMAICAILVSAQLGFVSLTYLSLQGADQLVAKMNLFVLIVTGAFTVPVILGLINMQSLIYVIVAVSCLSFLIRNQIAKQKTVNYLI